MDNLDSRAGVTAGATLGSRIWQQKKSTYLVLATLQYVSALSCASARLSQNWGAGPTPHATFIT